MTARHVTFTGPLQVEMKDRPLTEPGPGELLIRTCHTLISTGTELTVLRGKHAPGSVWERLFRFPWDAGYCNVGIVLKAGAGVTGLKAGDRVASTGPHASVFAIAEDACLAIPGGVTDDQAAFATIAQVVMQGVRLAGMGLGENAVVCGLGLLGQVAVALLRHVGCWPLIGVDLEPVRRQAAHRMGATQVTDPAAAEEVVRRHTEERMADAVFEVTGSPQAIPGALSWVRELGRFVLVSSPSGPTTIDFHDLVNARGIRIIGAHNYTHPTVANEYNRWTRAADTRYYLQLAEAGQLRLERLVTHRFPAERAAEAYHLLLTDRASTLAVMLDWSAAPQP